MTQQQRIVYFIIWGSGAIITLHIEHRFLGGGNILHIIPYIFLFYPIFMFVYVLYIMPLEWITIKMGIFERRDLYPPDTNKRVHFYRNRTGSEEE